MVQATAGRQQPPIKKLKNEMDRVRNVDISLECGLAGAVARAVMSGYLAMAEAAIAENDDAAMAKAYKLLKGCVS